MRPHFAGNQAVAEETAFRNSSLQGGYFIIAARAVGLDCGPMSGFDKAKVNAEFFPDGKWKVNFLCNLGYGDHSKLFPRSPRLGFDEACRVL
jgi:nitroreductase